jgi:hypothetical protein
LFSTTFLSKFQLNAKILSNNFENDFSFSSNAFNLSLFQNNVTQNQRVDIFQATQKLLEVPEKSLNPSLSNSSLL